MFSVRSLKPFNDNKTESRFKEAIEYFRERSPVIFVSQHYRFWEKHGFVQQSLARALVQAGIPVYWLDAAGWRQTPPVVSFQSPLLTITKLPQLPLRRFELFESLTPVIQTTFLKRLLAKGKKPFLWVLTGLDERVVRELPYVDVYSVFDDPYIHSPQGILSEKAKLILVQNEYTKKLFSSAQPSKTQLALPPMDMEEALFEDNSEFELPPSFPEKIMGYVGTFAEDGYDLLLFEEFLRSFPDWGFILAGRTDDIGKKRIDKWDGYRNFLHVDWVPREKVGSLWRCLDVNLMLYRPHPTSDGAFPVKLMEALHYGIPSIATRVPKTSSLEGKIPRFLLAEDLKSQAVKAGLMATQNIEALHSYFKNEMDPKLSLARVTEFLVKSSC